MGLFKNLAGQKFGRLTVFDTSGKTKSGNYTWNVICDCGNKKTLPSDHLTRKLEPVRSCGCYRDDRIRETCSPNPNKTAFNLLVCSYRKQARHRGIAFDLTRSQVADVTCLPCYYCGAEPSQVITNKTKTGIHIYNGIDRVDNAVGYKKSNCVACCKSCNYAKRALSENEFRELICKIYHNWANK